MLYEPLYVTIIFLLTCLVSIPIILNLKHKRSGHNIRELIETYNCFNFKVTYDVMLLEQAKNIMTDDIDPEKRKELLETLNYIQQTISCEDIIQEIKK